MVTPLISKEMTTLQQRHDACLLWKCLLAAICILIMYYVKLTLSNRWPCGQVCILLGNWVTEWIVSIALHLFNWGVTLKLELPRSNITVVPSGVLELSKFEYTFSMHIGIFWECTGACPPIRHAGPATFQFVANSIYTCVYVEEWHRITDPLQI